jgi:predicted ATPase
MITRLEVDGFKSLQGFAVDLEPFTVFIGPNSAGKSNILEALALLSRLASEPIADAFKHGRGRASDQFSRHGDEVAREIRFAVEFLFFGALGPGDRLEANDPSRFRYELTIERTSRPSGTERLLVQHEALWVMGPDQDPWIGAHPEFAAFAAYRGAGQRKFVVTPQERVDRRRTMLAQESSDATEWVSNNLVACQWIRLDVNHLAGPSERVDTGALSPDGANLPTVLADLPPALLGEVRAELVTLVPGIASFFVVPEDDSFRVEFELSGGERLPARLVSDGTLRLLALLTALRLESRPYLIGIEEPENGIYPGRLRALLETLRGETERRPHEEPALLAALAERVNDSPGGGGVVENLLPTQILLTTHSPVLLAALQRRPQHLRFIDTVHRDGRRVTRARAVGRPGSAERRHLVISPREIEQLLDAATHEDPG